MKLLLAVDGSKFTDKALAFLLQHQSLLGLDNELLVVNVQAPVPGRVTSMLGSADVAAYHAEEANKVLEPIKQLLEKNSRLHRCISVVGAPVEEILFAAKNEHAEMIVMGTHGHGWIGRALMGSIAQQVIADSEIPVLLVK